ncbi:hypothetical protein HKX48_002460 [Thoreauomyces humboldtii]|nr:hypothetical protein HKX48_002460 [Thoreauomyces humboldtii]
MSEITIKVKQANETAFSVTVSVEGTTVLQLKEKIAVDHSVPVAEQRLIFAGKVLKDADTLATYKMADGNTVHMVRGSATPRTAPPPAAAPAPTPNTEPIPNLFGGVPGGAAAGANPFAAFGGAGGAGNPFAAFGGAGGAGGLGGLDPNMMSSLLSNPGVSSSIAQMMGNPQVIEQLVAANPAMAGLMTPEVRAMMQSDMFRGMMSNPDMIRSMMQMGAQGGAGGGGAAANPLAALMGGAGGGNAFGGAQPTTGPTPQANAAAGGGMPPMMNPAMLQMLMGGMGGGLGGAPAAPADTRPPEERFQVQLGQLQDMGFYSAQENVRALTLTHGNVEAAVEWLFQHPPGSI